MKNIRIFISENFQFLVVKFSVYLNRRVFVMGPDVCLTLCCFVVHSTRRFVLSFAWCYSVLVFFSSLSIGVTPQGEENANLSAFRAFVRSALLWFCLFLPSTWCLGRAAACDCGTPRTFLLP